MSNELFDQNNRNRVNPVCAIKASKASIVYAFAEEMFLMPV
jgi:hypothetical protein